jgi:hypothetical protein
VTARCDADEKIARSAFAAGADVATAATGPPGGTLSQSRRSFGTSTPPGGTSPAG